MTLFELEAILSLNARDFSAGIQTAKSNMNTLEEEMIVLQDGATKTSSVLEGAFGHALGDVLSGVTEGLIQAAFDFAEGSVDVAASVEQTNEKLKALFGVEGAAQIRAWAETTKTNYGISAQAAKQYAADIAGLWGGEHIGFETEELMEMAEGLVELTGDLASFNNFTVEETWTKILSGMRGETEAIEDLGIDLRAASIAPFFDMTAKEWGNLDQKTRILNTYSYALAVTSHAQGDFARTEDSYQNQMAIFNANIEELQASLGEGLLPVMTDLLSFFNGFFVDTKSADEVMDELGSTFVDTYAQIDTTTANALALVDALAAMEEQGVDTAEEQSVWNQLLENLSQTLPGIDSLINTTTGAINGGTEALSGYVKQWQETQREIALASVLQSAQAEIMEKSVEVAALQLQLKTSAMSEEEISAEIQSLLGRSRDYLGMPEDMYRSNEVFSALADASASGDAYAQYIVSRLDQLDNAGEGYEELQSQLLAAEAQLADLNEEYTQLQSQITTLTTETQQPVNDLNNSVTDMNGAVDQLREAAQNLSAAATALANKQLVAYLDGRSVSNGIVGYISAAMAALNP